MKTKCSILILSGICFFGCDVSQKPNLSYADSLKIAKQDSIQFAFTDSLEKAKAAQEAFLNRPWKLQEFVDDFGESTGSKYIKTQIDGVFSNTATTGSYLFAEIIIEKKAAGVFLHEYGRDKPAEKFIGGGQVQLKNEAGEKLVINTYKDWNNSGGILIDNSIGNDLTKLKSFIKRSTGLIKVVVFDDYSSKYIFSISPQGFEEELKKLSI